MELVAIANQSLDPGQKAASTRSRAPITIEGTATEDVSAPAEISADAEATRPAQRGACPSNRGQRPFRVPAIAAALVAGVGLGFWLGAINSNHPGDGVDIARAEARTVDHDKDKGLNEIEIRLAKLQSDMERVASLATTHGAVLTARLDKFDQDTAARFQTMEKALANRDASASIHSLPVPLPMPPLAPAIGGTQRMAQTTLAKNVERSRVPRGGWVLREVRDGFALVEGANGMREVTPGDILPGAGRVNRVERRAGQWVLVTASGIIDMDGY